MPVTRARVNVRVLTEASRIRIIWAAMARIMASIIPWYDACDQGKGEGESAHWGQQDSDYEHRSGYGIHYTWIRCPSPGQGWRWECSLRPAGSGLWASARIMASIYTWIRCLWPGQGYKWECSLRSAGSGLRAPVGLWHTLYMLPGYDARHQGKGEGESVQRPAGSGLYEHWPGLWHTVHYTCIRCPSPRLEWRWECSLRPAGSGLWAPARIMASIYTWIRCLWPRQGWRWECSLNPIRIRIMSTGPVLWHPFIPGYDARHQGKGEGESAHRGQKYPDDEQGPGCGERMQQERGHHLRDFFTYHISVQKLARE